MKHILITITAVVLLIGCAKKNYSNLNTEDLLILQSAAIKGDLSEIKIAVEGGFDPNTMLSPLGLNKVPLLHWASMAENIDVIKYLITKGASVDLKNSDGTTALMLAGSKGRAKNVRILIQNNADIFAKDKNEATTAHWITACLSPELFRELIQKGVDFNVKDNQGRTPLMWAISRPPRLTIEWNTNKINQAIGILIEQSKDIDTKDKTGRSALHQAVKLNYMKLLIDNGADINLKDNEGFTPLDTASLGNPILGKNIHLIEYLINNSAKSGADESFTIAIKTWNKEALIKHLDNGANPNQKVNDEYSLLDNYFLEQKRKNSEDQFSMLGMATSELDRSKKRNEDNEELLEKIISKGGTNTLVGAIGIRDANLIKELVANKKINPNIRKKNGAPAVFDLFSDISNPLSGLMDMNSMMGWKKEDFESLNMLLDNNLDVNLAIIDPMMMQPKTILDCLEQELELARGMPGMTGMPDSSSLEKQFKELISKIKSKGGTNAAPSNLWSEDFDPSKIRSQTNDELKTEVK